MSKERYNEIIDEVYKNYSEAYEKDNSIGLVSFGQNFDSEPSFGKPDIKMFISICSHNKLFSKKWGLQIEERELSLEERNKWSWDNWGITCEMESVLDEQEVPKRAITLTYKNETISYYE